MINIICIINWIVLIAGIFFSYLIGKKKWPQTKSWIPPLVFVIGWLAFTYLIRGGSVASWFEVFFILPYLAQ